jgi:hypothetical protein
MKFKPMLLAVGLTVLSSSLALAQAPVHQSPQPEAPAVVGKPHAKSGAKAQAAAHKKHKAGKKSAAKKGKKKPAKHGKSAKLAKHPVH